MEQQLQGKVALVTGSNRGIGAAIATRLALEGAEVVINYPFGELREEAEALVSKLSEMGRMAIAVQADVTQMSEVEAMVKQAEQELGPIGILVNNAGITRDGLFIRLPYEAWTSVLDVNLNGAYHCCKAVIPSMMKQKQGAIVNVASLMALTGNAGQANYCASKGALISLTKSLAREYASRGIRANAVALLASNDASYITGHVLVIDGGWMMP